MHKQAIKHKQAIIGGGYHFTENACLIFFLRSYRFVQLLSGLVGESKCSFLSFSSPKNVEKV